MGYLNNQTITVDAILTKKGRELLSKGQQYFNITQFALSDDEVDYHLWNSAHPSGSNYYGYAIEQMPVLEPTPDETQTMRYKLVSLDKSTVRIPVVSVVPTTITLYEGVEAVITPNTIQGGSSGGSAQTVNLNSKLGYTAILHNSDAAYLQVVDAAPSGVGSTLNSINARIASLQAQIDSMRRAGAIVDDRLTQQLNAAIAQQQQLQMSVTGTGTGIFLGDTEAARSVFAVGLKFKLIGKGLTEKQLRINTTVTIIGNETGGSATISISTINR